MCGPFCGQNTAVNILRGRVLELSACAEKPVGGVGRGGGGTDNPAGKGMVGHQFRSTKGWPVYFELRAVSVFGICWCLRWGCGCLCVVDVYYCGIEGMGHMGVWAFQC